MTIRRPAVALTPRNSKQASYTVMAYEKGYRALDDGTVMGPRGVRALRRRSRLTRYLVFTFRSGHETRSVFVHQLVAYEKYGDRAFLETVQVRHLDGDYTNNSYGNVAIGSPSENWFDVVAAKRQERGRFAAAFRRRLTDEQAAVVRRRVAAGERQTVVARELGLAKSTVHYIVAGHTYKQPAPTTRRS